VQSWDWVQNLSDWIVEWFYDETTGKWGLQNIWGNWSDWVQSWDWVQKFSDWWNDVIGTWWNEDVVKWFTVARWKSLLGNILTSFQNVWSSIKTWWNNTAISKWWNEDVVKWFTIAGWTGLFNNIWASFQNVWGDIKTWWNNTAISKWWNEDVVKWFTIARWKDLLTNIWTSFKEIWGDLETWWNDTIAKWWEEDVAKWFTVERWTELLGNIWTAFQEIWGDIKTWWNSTVGKWWEEDVIKWFTVERWTELLGNIWTAFQEIWSDTITAAKDWGKNLIQNFIDGIKSKFSDLESVALEGINIVKNIFGFSSPTEEGPGRDADKWAPNLMKMFAEGISGGVPEIRSAVNDVAGQLTNLAVQPMVQPELIAQTVIDSDTLVGSDSSGNMDKIGHFLYQAIIDGFRIIQASQSNGNNNNGDLVIKINNRELAREQLPALIREGQRQGVDIILRPRGA